MSRHANQQHPVATRPTANTGHHLEIRAYVQSPNANADQTPFADLDHTKLEEKEEETHHVGGSDHDHHNPDHHDDHDDGRGATSRDGAEL